MIYDICVKSSFEKRTFLIRFVKTKTMTIKEYYSQLKTADDLMSNHLHNKLSTVLRNIIPLAKDSEQQQELMNFYKNCEELPFANKGSEEYIEVRRITYQVLEFIEENLIN